ncbi:hypothetical protein DV738_g4156, partial [Chaetothyriales sp. CBS 135597]
MANSAPDSLAASPTPDLAAEKDNEMADENDTSPVELLAQLLITFIEKGIATELARARNSEAKMEADRAAQEYDKLVDKVANKPPVLQQIETRKQTAEQGYNKSSVRLASASKSCDSAARGLATTFLDYARDHSALTGKSLEQDSDSRPWMARVDKLESTQAGIDERLMSAESRVAAFETSAVSNRAQVMEKISALRDEYSQEMDSLRSQVKDLSTRLDFLSAEVSSIKHLGPLPDHESDLERKISRLDTEMTELKRELTCMREERQKQSDPLAESPMFLAYVQRYQRDRTEDLEKINAVTEASSRTSQKLQEHETKMSSSLLSVEAKILICEAGQASLQESVASIKQNRDKQSDYLATELEAELRRAVSTNTSDLNQLRVHVDSVIQLQHKHMDEASKKFQQLESFLRNMEQNLSKQVAAAEHSIKVLTARYNNLSSEQLAKRMASHINQFPSTLQAEQNSLKTRIDDLESQHKAQKEALETIRGKVGENSARSSSDELSRQDFENRMKSQYYDVLEEKVREYRDDIRGSIQSLRSEQVLLKGNYEVLGDKLRKYHDENRADIEVLRSEQKLIQAGQEALENRAVELEGKALLSSFQRPSPLPEVSHKRQGSSDSLFFKPENDGTTNGHGKQRSCDPVEDSIVARPLLQPSRKRPRP